MSREPTDHRTTQNEWIVNGHSVDVFVVFNWIANATYIYFKRRNMR